MGKNCLRGRLPALGAFVLFLSAVVVSCSADTVLYNDGVWIVNGIDQADSNFNHIAVSVNDAPLGSFTELTVLYSFAGAFPLVYSMQADGALSPAVPPTGVLGGAFHLTGYWDCFAGQQPEVRIISLNIQPNTKNFKYLRFNGALSNGTSLQATDLTMKLYIPDNSSVRMDVSYTLYAMSNICVDQSRQQTGEGFQVARIASNYISDEIMDNDGMNVKGFLGPNCGCCGCNWSKGYICANFVDETGYLLPYFAWMANSQLLMLHALPGPQNTPALSIGIKKPGRSQCGAQGYTVFTTDPSEDNVDLWINWGKANSQYSPGQKVQKIKLNLVGELPQAVSCDLVVP